MEGNDQTTPLDLALLGPLGIQIAALVAVIRLLITPPDPPPKATKPFVAPMDAFHYTVSGVYEALTDYGLFAPFAHLLAWVAGTIVLLGGALGAMLLWLLKHVGGEFAVDVLTLVDAARKTIDPTVAVISVSVLNELLGTEFSAEHLATGEDVGAHLARASTVGGLFHQQLLAEFRAEGDVTPEAGAAAARRFTGFLVNFGTATALISIAGDLASFGKFEQFRELGVEVARNLGLGRIHRQVMKPLIKILIATPYEWFLNMQFHPTQFKVEQLINPFAQEQMDHDTVFKAMDLLGYSTDKIEKLIQLHSKKVPLAVIEILDRYGITAREGSLLMMRFLGYQDDVSGIILQGEDLKRADAAVHQLVDLLETEVRDGHLAIDDFKVMLDELPLGFYEKKFRMQVAGLRKAVPHAHLTVAQAQKAFDEGVWDLDQLDAFFTARGYTPDDAGTLRILSLLGLAQLDEAKKVAQYNWERRVAAADKKHLPPPPKPPILVK